MRRTRDGGCEIGGLGLLPPNTLSRTQRKGLTGFFVIAHIRDPSLGFEDVGVVEVFRVVCHGPGAGVEFGLQLGENEGDCIS